MLPCTPACWDQQNDHQCLLTHPSAGAPTVLRFSVKYNHLSANMNLTRKVNGNGAMRKIRGRLARTIQPIRAEGRPELRAAGKVQKKQRSRVETGNTCRTELPATGVIFCSSIIHRTQGIGRKLPKKKRVHQSN